MTFTFPITLGEHYRATRAVANRQTATKVAYAFFLGAPLVILVVALARGFTVGEVLREHWGALLGGPAFVILGVPLLHYWNVRSAHASNPSLRGEQTFELTGTGFATRGPLHSTTLRWDALTRVVETPRFFLFYLSKNVAYFLPTREVERAGRLEELRALLPAQRPGRARLARSGSSRPAA